jgi:hypothetical protein
MLPLRRKCLLVPAVVAGLLTAALAQRAGAVINGTPDGTAHRDVGALVHIDAGELHAGAPSGVLVTPTVMIVAGHSVIQAEPAQEQSNLWVSFAPVVDKTFAGGIKVIHIATLFPAIDIGVLVLAEPAHDAQGPITPATLPPAGLLDQLAAAHQLQDLPLTLVGYGMSNPADLSTLGTRRHGLERAQALPPGCRKPCWCPRTSQPQPANPWRGEFWRALLPSGHRHSGGNSFVRAGEHRHGAHLHRDPARHPGGTGFPGELRGAPALMAIPIESRGHDEFLADVTWHPEPGAVRGGCPGCAAARRAGSGRHGRGTGDADRLAA